MIDLHTHVLPGLDDGPETLADALDLLERIAAGGVQTVVATPHVSELFPNRADTIRVAVAEVREGLAERNVSIDLLSGAEVTIEAALALPDEELRELCLAGGGWLLVESPLSPSAGDFDVGLATLRERGFQLVLAHPERCPAFQRNPQRVIANVAAGDLCAVTAGAMSGRFGRTVRRFTQHLLQQEMVHDVASDAHNLHGRPPGLLEGFLAMEEAVPGLSANIAWHTEHVPSAIIAGRRPDPVPPLPPPPSPRSWWHLRRR